MPNQTEPYGSTMSTESMSTESSKSTKLAESDGLFTYLGIIGILLAAIMLLSYWLYRLCRTIKELKGPKPRDTPQASDQNAQRQSVLFDENPYYGADPSYNNFSVNPYYS